MKGKFEKATNENHNNHQKIKSQLKMDMRPPGFEPGLEAREAPVLPLDYDRLLYFYPMSDT